MNVNVGELNKKIAIYTKTIAKDADGYPVETPVPVHSCWAKFSRTSGTEMTKANADFSEVKVRFLIRYTSKSINRKMTVQYGGDEYEIVYINDYEDGHEYIEIWCSLMTNAG